VAGGAAATTPAGHLVAQAAFREDLREGLRRPGVR